MDKIALIVTGGSSGPTHHMRVGDRRKTKINIPNFFFIIKYSVYQRWRRPTGTNICSSIVSTQKHAHSHFSSADLGEIEGHLAATQVEPGVSYFNARRELWLSGKKKIPRPDEIVDSITRLDEMVRDPRALRSDRVWEAGLGRISKRLIEGGRLKYNLPMHLLVCNATRPCIRSSRPSFSR